MEINAEHVNGLLLAKPKDRIDGTNSRVFEESLVEAIGDSGCSVILDFEELHYISSAGLRAILLTAKKVKNTQGQLVLCSLTEPIKEVFELSGFDKIIPIYANRDEALAALSS
ncbi:MAG: STAS domain-containing protein [Albidovulum sp.]|nr:STAS domain-containing protein [Albidovulum sp.]MDE0306287.1 STAS domain-containing protein [Albidovulum sp.]MDE0531328.1 STAS domain-containing protein [Albidovulum sp.]